MKLKPIIPLILTLTCILISVSTVQAFSGTGLGTQQNPYIITNVYQLQEMNNDLDAWYALGNDIDASDTVNWNGGEGFLPIGSGTTFRGSFDGHGFTISGLYINRPAKYMVGRL